MGLINNHPGRLTERERVRIYSQARLEQIKGEALDILIDELHRQMRDGATVSFEHNLALKIEKLIGGNVQRSKIAAMIRTEIYKARP